MDLIPTPIPKVLKNSRIGKKNGKNTRELTLHSRKHKSGGVRPVRDGENVIIKEVRMIRETKPNQSLGSNKR
jgi:hypothetical protein